jgi:hypothetical protein
MTLVTNSVLLILIQVFSLATSDAAKTTVMILKQVLVPVTIALCSAAITIVPLRLRL